MLAGEADPLPRDQGGYGCGTNYQPPRGCGVTEASQATAQGPGCSSAEVHKNRLTRSVFLGPIMEKCLVHLASLVHKVCHISAFFRYMQLSDENSYINYFLEDSKITYLLAFLKRHFLS